METIAITAPVAPYQGGKRNLAGRICAALDATPCLTYAEPFVGMGGVFLRRRARPRCEVINDISRDVTNLFRILQRHLPQFLDTIRFQITSRAEFERLMAVDPDTLTDLERAARFLYLQRTAFGGKVVGRNFGVARDRPSRFNLTTLEPMLDELHSRLARVVIERLDWPDFIARYDGPDTLFYLDPPYLGCETDYGDNVFDRAAFAKMAEQLAQIRGRFVLSLNDTPEVRATFNDCPMASAVTTYGIAGPKGQGRAKERAELLITGRSRPVEGILLACG